MSLPTCSCSDSDLLLASHRALPLPALLQIQLHRLLCPACRERYRRLHHVSQQLADAMSPHPSPARAPRLSASAWGAALLCTLALSAAAWSAHAYLVLPDSRLCVNAPVHIERCESPKVKTKKPRLK